MRSYSKIAAKVKTKMLLVSMYILNIIYTYSQVAYYIYMQDDSGSKGVTQWLKWSLFAFIIF